MAKWALNPIPHGIRKLFTTHAPSCILENKGKQVINKKYHEWGVKSFEGGGVIVKNECNKMSIKAILAILYNTVGKRFKSVRIMRNLTPDFQKTYSLGIYLSYRDIMLDQMHYYIITEHFIFLPVFQL